METTIANLGIQELKNCPAWRWTGRYDSLGNEVVVPVEFTITGHVPATAGEVHCLCVCEFADGSKHDAYASGRQSAGAVGGKRPDGRSTSQADLAASSVLCS